MKIYDISQEVFSCEVYPGDPLPKKEILSSIGKGAFYNLTAFSMCAHNGTHIDAPYHFFCDGKTVDEISLEKLVGFCYVAEFNGVLGNNDALMILEKAEKLNIASAKKILLKGKCEVSIGAAEVFAKKKIDLIGVESQTVGPENAPMAVHKVLLGGDVVLLEGIRLSDVNEGVYFLSASSLLLKGSDGAPVRAVLIDFDDREEN